jgi:hypothetical protein
LFHSISLFCFTISGCRWEIKASHKIKKRNNREIVDSREPKEDKKFQKENESG